jgi:hypothetical protein
MSVIVSYVFSGPHAPISKMQEGHRRTIQWPTMLPKRSKGSRSIFARPTVSSFDFYKEGLAIFGEDN